MKSFLKKLTSSGSQPKKANASGSLRKGHRVPLALKMEIQSQGPPLSVVTEDLSTMGVSFVSSTYLVDGQEIQLTLFVPAGEEVKHLKAKATIEWTSPTDEEWTLGASFTEIDQDAKKLLQETILAHLKKSKE